VTKVCLLNAPLPYLTISGWHATPIDDLYLDNSLLELLSACEHDSNMIDAKLIEHDSNIIEN
jgi:hypothetical protein